MQKHCIVAAIGSLMFFACTQIPTDMDNLVTKRYSDNLEYCWEALVIFSIFQDKVPSTARGFYSAKDLYKTIGDPWTRYYNTDTALIFLSYLTTSGAGIGVLIDSAGNGIRIKEVFPNSPGERAGLQANDTIVAVNGTNLETLSFDARLSLLGGSIGEILRLTVRRGAQELEIAVTLGTYMAPSVFVDSLDSLTAYIYISEFSDSTSMPGGTSAEFDAALRKTQWAAYTVLDLRENGGGIVDECLDVAGEFVPQGTPLMNSMERTYDETTAPDGATIDTVWGTTLAAGRALQRKGYVLVDSFTASASEIVVSCLRDYRTDVKSVGTHTYGKARGQYIFFPTPDYGLAKVTFSLITPVLGQSYDQTGITPDRPISDGEDALTVARNIIRLENGLPPLAKAHPDASRLQERIRRLHDQVRRPFIEPLGAIKKEPAKPGSPDRAKKEGKDGF